MEKRKCIYCLEEKDVSKDFTGREHVIPQAYGRFEPNNMVLRCVCDECNRELGRELNHPLGRDSHEAHQRPKHGLKPATDFVEEVGESRVAYSIAAEGEWKGIPLTPKEEGGEVVYDLRRGVEFGKKGAGGVVFMTARDLANLNNPIPEEADLKSDFKIIALSDADLVYLESLLIARDIRPRTKKRLSHPPAKEGDAFIETQFLIDPVIRRAFAKIAFNYMAFVESPEFALHEDFNEVRDFIRFGKLPEASCVKASNDSILAGDTPTKRQTAGHVIVLAWPPRKDWIGCGVSLFNDITYTVLLARKFSGVWRDIRHGNHFDVSTRKITEVLGTSLAL